MFFLLFYMFNLLFSKTFLNGRKASFLLCIFFFFICTSFFFSKTQDIWETALKSTAIRLGGTFLEAPGLYFGQDLKTLTWHKVKVTKTTQTSPCSPPPGLAIKLNLSCSFKIDGVLRKNQLYYLFESAHFNCNIKVDWVH